MIECSKCGGEMIQGEAYVDINTSPAHNPMSGIMPTMSGMNLGYSENAREERIKWHEKTGKKKGFLIKSDEIRTMIVIGRRCLECGYIEFYAQE
jgi:predicted nucleic-acid-binding Zn-ribbon protein